MAVADEGRMDAGRVVNPGKALLALGVVLLLLGALCDARLVARLHFRTPLSTEAREETARSRRAFAAGGLVLLAAGELVRRRRGLTRRGARWLVAGLSLVVPLLVLERGARPFVERLTTLFEVDPELGWKNRPLADDTYWGARARINAAGMRGPERALEKPAGVRRVLVLGDSVVFGLMLEDETATIPARLERELAERTGLAFECLGAGVCGWSSRQQRRFLEREGERWQPDLVVLGFVLNDVAESAGGGTAAQLAYMRPPGMPGWLAQSGLHLALRELDLRRALAGDSPEAQAHRNRLTAYHLILQPDSDPVQAAWRTVLPELDALLAWCRERSLPLVLVVFPYTVQLREPAANAPQRNLEAFARRRALPFLDLLPPLVAVQRARDLAETELFLDGLHPSALGAELAAAELARFLIEQGLVL